jgi:hypothetical protein
VNANEVYVQMRSKLRDCYYSRCVVDSRSPCNHNVREAAFGTTYIVDIVHNVPTFRKLNGAWLKGNILHFFSNTESANPLAKINPEGQKFLSREGSNWFWRGAYGPVFMPQLEACVKLLRDDPETRRAIALSQGPFEFDMNRPACWTSLHFMLQDSVLNMHVYQRSLHLTRALPYDITLLTNILNYMSYATANNPGWLHWTIGSLHCELRDELPDPIGDASQLLLPVELLSSSNACWSALDAIDPS